MLIPWEISSEAANIQTFILTELNGSLPSFIANPYTRNRRQVITKSISKSLQTVAPPTSLDWVVQGRVTAVKDQGQCSDCYAFATTAVMEGLVASKTGKLLNLSSQEITDCSQKYELQYFGAGK
ncbi:unnamed protein product, partial [Didymodactylos carnosus]